MLTRRLSYKLLAPTVLVSLVLVAACTFGLFYLNSLHVNASDVLSENEKSTRAALRLEAATTSLVHWLRDQAQVKPGPELSTRLERLQKRFQDAEELANLPGERRLVRRIADGRKEFDRELKRQLAHKTSGSKLADLLEKNVLQPCQLLTRFNTVQIEKSNDENRDIVRTLRWGLLAVGFGGPLIGLLLGYAVARGLSRSMYQLSVRMRDAAGRLNRELGSVTLEERGDLPDLHRQMQGVVVEIERVVEQLQQRDREVLRAEQLAAVGQVAAGVAHELRNPLTSVKILVQTGLESGPPAGLPSEDLAIIEHEIRRMEQCIQMLIDFARPPNSERRPSNLVEIVRRAAALVEGRARRQKVTLVADLPASPVVAEVDPDQIHQVVVNLLLNALDALPRGGTIHVTIPPLPLVGSKDVRRWAGVSPVEVRVKDTGAGIPAGIWDRLFEPFVSSKETGLGLGLSICKRLVEANGGTIRGQNAPEGGAVFAFTLPAVE